MKDLTPRKENQSNQFGPATELPSLETNKGQSCCLSDLSVVQPSMDVYLMPMGRTMQNRKGPFHAKFYNSQTIPQ